jgi:tetratricopeptide (TPR) repeat protein
MGLLLALGLAAQEAQAAPPARGSWLRLRTGVAELVTDARPELAREAARRLQRFAEVLRVAAPVTPRDTRGALVLALSDQGTFAALRPGRGGRAFEVDGFVQGGADRTMVAVNLAARRPDPLQTLEHEYVHLALNGALPAQPAWLAEGLAELLSDWREDESGVRVGGVRAEHLRVLSERPLLSMEQLLAAGYTTPEFVDPELRPVLYAQSWALVRLLLLDDGDQAGARARLLAFLGALAMGGEPPAAFQATYGYDLAEAEARLRRSLATGGPPAMRLPLPPGAAGTAAVESAPKGLAQALVGELLLRQDRDQEARRRFEAALEEDPGLADPHEGLAHLALRRGRWEDARTHLDAALRRRPDDAPALYRMADLLVREAAAAGGALSDAAEERAVRLLERAVTAAPHHGDAASLLAHLRPEPRSLRIRMVEEALLRNPARTDLALTLAGLHLDGQDPQGAAAALVRARDGTRDDTQRFLAQHLLRRLGEATAGTVEARGRLAHLECRPGGALDFVVDAGPRRLRLRAATPASVMLQDGSGDLLQRELVCGPQRGAVRVRYRPLAEPPAGQTFDGMLLTLRFLPS